MKDVKITYSDKIKESKFDYKEFIKGIKLPEGSEWIADIAE